MSTTVVIVIVGVASYAASVITTAFILGVKWGKVTSDIVNMKQDLAEIKGMFRLTLKE